MFHDWYELYIRCKYPNAQFTTGMGGPFPVIKCVVTDLTEK